MTDYTPVTDAMRGAPSKKRTSQHLSYDEISDLKQEHAELVEALEGLLDCCVESEMGGVQDYRDRIKSAQAILEKAK